ncbi:hypothetical protein PENCOP_c017G03061 [Penicillium coprophilum]|uniref:BTB domain-containing protein n=1 Tax=Penicillium coprophilum TaxID=36646 RepID=A0A1V6U7W6_9EURO|nr:hypothetical protein PENCOP_c017G03061 [Penicillium coprophilum]
MSATMAAGPLQPPYQVDPDRDIVLFTPKTPLIDISKGNVPGNYARCQVSSKYLALLSAYFKRMLKNRWTEGDALRTNGSAEVPVNNCKPDILLIILNLIHGQLRQIPRHLLSKLTRENVFYSLTTACSSESDQVPSITVNICELSPNFIYSMITEWSLDVPCRPASRCFNKANPLGNDGKLQATHIYDELTGLDDLPLTS